MARKNICVIPGCDREIKNQLRGLCQRCDSSRHYWKRRQLERGEEAVEERLQRLKFFTGRLSWLYKTHEID